MAKVRELTEKEISKVNLRITSAREKIFLREFVEVLMDETADITEVEIREAKKVALLRFRDSRESNCKKADEVCQAMFDQEDEEEE